MGKADRIRLAVEDFWRRNSIGDTPADAFPAWWIATTFEASAQDAVRRCATGSGDCGLDGFYLEHHAERGWILNLVQAKFSNSKALVKKAVDGFERTLGELRGVIDRKESAPPNRHPIFTRLSAELDRHSVVAGELRLHFYVIHLCEESADLLMVGTTAARDRFRDEARGVFPDLFHELFILGPDEMKPWDGEAPAEKRTIRFEGTELKTSSGVKYYTGLTRLSDLVSLYDEYGDQLFSKNVRYYLFKEKGNTPVRYMQETLREICTGDRDPEHFAMFHNGVTLAVQSLELSNGTVVIRQPSVLNGCQTIRNASGFIPKLKNLDAERWRAVPVPVRILVTTNEDFVRNVTVSNNRQTPVRPSAFYANDRLQLDLTRRFAAMKVFYERQEGAFRSLRSKQPLKLENDYANSVAAPLTMEDLAQAIAVVSDKPALSVAARVMSLFEETVYPRVFDEKKLSSLELLIFLRNVLRTVKVVLKDAKDRSSKLEGLPLDRFRYPSTKILARYIVRNAPDAVHEHGGEIYGHVGPSHPFRQALLKFTHHLHSGLQQLIPEFWDDGEEWGRADDGERVRRALRRLRLEDYDVFAEYQEVESV